MKKSRRGSVEPAPGLHDEYLIEQSKLTGQPLVRLSNGALGVLVCVYREEWGEVLMAPGLISPRATWTEIPDAELSDKVVEIKSRKKSKSGPLPFT